MNISEQRVDEKQRHENIDRTDAANGSLQLKEIDNSLTGNNELSKSEAPELFTGDLEAAIDNHDQLSRYDSNAHISRSLSRRFTGAESLISRAQESKEPMPTMGGGRDLPPQLPDSELYIVLYDGNDDPTHPYQWSSLRKIFVCAVSGISALSVTMGSSMYSQGQSQIMDKFHIGREVATLGTTLFVLGFATGPVVWGPFSELYGRKIVMICSNIGFISFAFGVAVAKDIQTVMLCRFFGGCIGAAPIVVAPAILSDLFTPLRRGQAMAIFALVLFGGPMVGPVIAACATKNQHLGWRWTSYISAFISCLGLVLVVFLLPETSHPALLVGKAEELRRRTGNWGIHAAHEEVSLSPKEIVEKTISRPLVMLLREPILFLITLYNAFIYGLLYLLLTAIPLIFQGKYKWKMGIDVLPYLGVLVGTAVGAVINVIIEGLTARRLAKTGGKYVAEYRLLPMMAGSFPFCGGLFWLCWAGNYGNKVHWIVPTIGGSFVGCGLLLIFLPCLNYIIDCYLFFAASAIAGNTFLRSIFGAVFPLFGYQMFTKMHINWAGTLLGCVAAILIPVPFMFYKWGHIIRAKSAYAT